MRPRIVESPDTSLPFPSLAKPGLSARLRETAEHTKLKLAEISGKEKVLQDRLKRATDTTGFSLTVAQGLDVEAILYVPPTSFRARELQQKALRFAQAHFRAETRDQYSVRNPVSSYQSDGTHSFFLNPDYDAARKGMSQNINNLRIDIAAKVSIDKEGLDDIAAYIDILSRFSEMEPDEVFKIQSLVEWEVTQRMNHNRFIWNVDKSGESSAEIKTIDPENESAKLRWQGKQMKEMFNQVQSIVIMLEDLQKVLPEYSSTRSAKHFGEHQPDVEKSVRDDIKGLIVTIEQDMQGVFSFLPQTERLFTEGDVSLANPEAYEGADEDIIEILQQDALNIQRFLRLVQESLFEQRFENVLNSSFSSQARQQWYAEKAPTDRLRGESVKIHGVLEQTVRTLLQLQPAFPEVGSQDLIHAYADLLSYHAVKREKNFYTWQIADVKRLSEYFPNFRSSHNDLFLLITAISEGSFPSEELVEKVTLKEIDDVIEQLKPFAQSNPLLMKTFTDLRAFIPILERLSKLGYHSYSEELKAVMRKLVADSMDAGSKAKSLSPEPLGAESAIQGVMANVLIALRIVEKKVFNYLQSPPAQS